MANADANSEDGSGYAFDETGVAPRMIWPPQGGFIAFRVATSAGSDLVSQNSHTGIKKESLS